MTRIAARRHAIDWAAIEQDYRAGALSLRGMADKHGCSHSTIANEAGRKGWVRETSNCVAARTPRAAGGHGESFEPHDGSG